MSPRSPQLAVSGKLWASHMVHKFIHLYSDNATAVVIFHAGRGRDEFIQTCAREVWIMCATWEITQVVGHIPGLCLADTVDALSGCHLGQGFRDKVALSLPLMDFTVALSLHTLCVPPDTV